MTTTIVVMIFPICSDKPSTLTNKMSPNKSISIVPPRANVYRPNSRKRAQNPIVFVLNTKSLFTIYAKNLVTISATKFAAR